MTSPLETVMLLPLLLLPPPMPAAHWPPLAVTLPPETVMPLPLPL